MTLAALQSILMAMAERALLAPVRFGVAAGGPREGLLMGAATDILLGHSMGVAGVRGVWIVTLCLRCLPGGCCSA
jgi:hypothetical protein